MPSEAWTGSEQQEATLFTWLLHKNHPVCQYCSLSDGNLRSSHSQALEQLLTGSLPALFLVKSMGNWVPCGH